MNEESNYMGNQNQIGYQQKQAPYQNQGRYQQRGNNQQYGQGRRLENSNRQNTYQNPPPQEKPLKLVKTLTQLKHASMTNQKSNEAEIKNLETQVGQLAKQLADRQSGLSFLENTQANPKEHCKAIFTRSGRVVGNGVGDVVENEEVRIG